MTKPSHSADNAHPVKLRRQKLASASRGGENAPLLDLVLNGALRLPRQHQDQKAFFRLFRRAASSPEFRRMLQRLRDSVMRSVLREKREGGIIVAVTGVHGGEGASFFSLLLALSLGASKHHRVAFLDGCFNVQRFEALTDVLDLAQNSCQLRKSDTEVQGYCSEEQPNVYFLKNSSGELSLDFFSDKQLEAFLKSLRQQFDFTIIDMPPLLAESSNVFVAPAVDRLYLTVSAGKTRLAEVDRCIQITEEAGGKISGVIVNHQKAPLWSRLFWKEYFF